MEKYLNQLEKNRAVAQREIDLITDLKLEFPDLEIDKDRWGRVRYMAKSANSRVNEVLFHRNCGCCDDSPIHARPYFSLPNGTKIYSNPCNAMIGKYFSWRKTYEEAGINPQIIKKIQKYIKTRNL